jgi:phosphate transport system substrate-binding protein
VKRSTLTRGLIPAAVAFSLVLAACGGDGDATDTATDAGGDAGAEDSEDGDADAGGEALSGSIEIDGSSTVGPLTDAISEEYAAVQPDVIVNLGISGSGGGFERFCGTGDTDISNASRPSRTTRSSSARRTASSSPRSGSAPTP